MLTTNLSASERQVAAAAAQSEKIHTVLGGQHKFTLPAWLAVAVTPKQVCVGLRRQVPEFISGQLAVHSCEVKRLRLRDSQGVWSGTLLLTIVGLLPDQPDQSTIVPVHGTLIPPHLTESMPAYNNHPFGSAAWHCYLPELHLELRTELPDEELAMMPQLTDPEQARRLLETSIRAGGSVAHQDIRIQACKPRIARYKPGSRCTLLYQLEYPAELAQNHHWPATVVAKTYRGDKGQNAYAGMQALWQSPLGVSHTVNIAEPLAYLPGLNVLIQSPLREEMTLKELIRHKLRPVGRAVEPGEPEVDPELAHYIRKTAVGLAELHQCGVHYGESIIWEDELAEIYELVAKLAKPLPQLADLADDLLSRLQTLAASQPADPLAPAHRSFRPAQVLLAGGEIGFIDFDGFCQAEPALDLALFMTTVKSLSVNNVKVDEENKEDGEAMDTAMNPETRLDRLIQAEAICALFLSEYEKHAPVSRTRIILWETLDLLSLVLSSWSKLKLARLDNCLFMLERYLIANAEVIG